MAEIASRVRTALFVDFDNIYSGLRAQDLAAAEAFAAHPEQWLSWLETTVAPSVRGGSQQSQRSILLRKCYLNPGAFGRFRPYFVRAGFQVVDCPPFTAGGKNGADIQMVMDILDALDHRTHFDEFVVLSGDSDFTPVLHRLRANDRRTVILAVGLSAAAYRAASDVLLTEEQFIERALLGGSGATDEASVPTASVAATSGPPAVRGQPRGDRFERAREVIRQMVAVSPRAIESATVAQRLQETFGESLVTSGWDGTGGFKAFVEQSRAPDERGFAISWAVPGYFYDPARHELPVRGDDTHPFATSDPVLDALARRIHELTNVPLLTPAEYAMIFRTIAEEVNANGYILTQTSRAVRDTCRERDTSVSRQEVNFILIGLVYSGQGLAGGHQDPKRLAVTFAQNVVRLSERAQLSLSEADSARIDAWIVGGFGDASKPEGTLETVVAGRDTAEREGAPGETVGPSPAGSVLASNGQTILRKLGDDWIYVALRIVAAVEDTVGGDATNLSLVAQLLIEFRDTLPQRGAPTLTPGDIDQLLVELAQVDCVERFSALMPDLNTGAARPVVAYRLLRQNPAVQRALEAGPAELTPGADLQRIPGHLELGST